MTRPLEQRLRDDLHDTAGEIRPSADLAGRVLDAADERDRGSRQAIAVTFIVSGVAAAAVAVALTGDPDRPKGQVTPPLNASTNRADDTTPPQDALASLPLGPPPDRPFVANDQLRDGDQIVALPGTDAGVVDRVAGGWLILVEHHSRSGFTSEFGVLTPDGQFRPLAGGNVFMQEAAVSPNGRQVFIDGAAVDVASGRIIATFSGRTGATIGWNATGVVYRSYAHGGTPSYLWALVRPPVLLSADVVMVARDSTRALVREPRCVSVVELLPNGATSQVARWCGDPVYELSPDGTYVLGRGPAARVVTGNDVVRFDALSAMRVQGDPGWEDNTHVLFPVELSGSRVQVLRCNVGTGDCERAGAPVRVDVNDTVSFSGLTGER